MSKSQKVSRRAILYAHAHYRKIVEGPHKFVDDHWTAGYRAAMRDVRKIINSGDIESFKTFEEVQDFVNDTERLK